MAQTEQHTPGPWVASRSPATGAWNVASARISGRTFRLFAGDHATEADANLAAAAPDMLAALEEWLTVGNDLKARKAVRENARAAIARATGASS